MSRPGSEKPEQERSYLTLDGTSPATSPPELRQPLAYVLHLRAHWKPKGRAKLIVPSSWMEFLAFCDKQPCGAQRTVNRPCPFRNVRFDERDAGTRLPREIVSQLLTSSGTRPDHDLTTFVSRAFEGIPQTRIRSDTVPATKRQRIDFVLVPKHGNDDTEGVFSDPPGNGMPCLLFGTKEPDRTRHPGSASFDAYSRPQMSVPVPEELTSYGRLNLKHIASLMKTKSIAERECFPEWLVLFGLLYDDHHVRIVAYVPYPVKPDVIDCVTYIVDQLSLDPSTTDNGVRGCELAFERLRFLAALATLRRHVYHLFKSLFTTIGPSDCIGRHIDSRSPSNPQDSDDSESLDTASSSRQCSSDYSTCPSSVHAREPGDIHRAEHSSSCRSPASSFCSTCLSSLESGSSSDSSRSEDSKYTDVFHWPDSLSEAKRRDIIAWAQEVMPTEHPVKDTYRMVISRP